MQKIRCRCYFDLTLNEKLDKHIQSNTLEAQKKTQKLTKFPIRASVKFQSIHKKISAFKAASSQFELESMNTLGRYVVSDSRDRQSFKRFNSDNKGDCDRDQKDNGGNYDHDDDE